MTKDSTLTILAREADTVIDKLSSEDRQKIHSFINARAAIYEEHIALLQKQLSDREEIVDRIIDSKRTGGWFNKEKPDFIYRWFEL